MASRKKTKIKAAKRVPAKRPARKAQVKEPRSCGNCGKRGHNVRTCGRA